MIHLKPTYFKRVQAVYQTYNSSIICTVYIKYSSAFGEFVLGLIESKQNVRLYLEGIFRPDCHAISPHFHGQPTWYLKTKNQK